MVLKIVKYKFVSQPNYEEKNDVYIQHFNWLLGYFWVLEKKSLSFDELGKFLARATQDKGEVIIKTEMKEL